MNTLRTDPNRFRFPLTAALVVALGTVGCSSEAGNRPDQQAVSRAADKDLGALLDRQINAGLNDISLTTGCTESKELGSGPVETRLERLFPAMAIDSEAQRKATQLSAAYIDSGIAQPDDLVMACELPITGIAPVTEPSKPHVTLAYPVDP